MAGKRAQAKTVSALTDVAVGVPSLYQQFNRLVGQRTPQQVSAIMRQADSGRPAALVDLTYESRQKDNHLHGVLQVREFSVSGLTFSSFTEDTALVDTKKAADVFNKAMRAAQGFKDAVNHMVSAGVLFTNGWVEVLWGMREGYLVPVAFTPVPTRRFFYREVDGKLLFDAGGISPNDATGIDLNEKYPRGKFMKWQPRITGDVAWRDGLCRPLVWAALFRNWTSRDWLTFAELAWKPWRHAKYAKGAGAGTDTIQKIVRVCEEMAASGVAVYPDSVDIKVEWPRNSTASSGKGAHQMLMEFYADEMSKAVIGGTDTMSPGDSGARASTEVRERVGLMLRDSTVQGIQGAIMWDLVLPFMEMNFGANVEPFEFRFDTEDTANIESFARGVRDLTTARCPLPTAWVRQRVGAPEPVAGEEVTSIDPAEQSVDGQPPKADDDKASPKDTEE